MSAEFFVGVDERFEVLAAPGLADSMEHAQRIAADGEVLKLMLGLGVDKGLRGVGLLTYSPSSIISKTPIRHLADLKGRKIRTLASQFQTSVFDRLFGKRRNHRNAKARFGQFDHGVGRGTLQKHSERDSGSEDDHHAA
jgi:TRAP-type C4-dicarboxylate transport system substrate-binding protein